MGKALSKGGMRVNTRRQQSQAISRHQERLNTQPIGRMPSPPSQTVAVVPRVLELDRTILSLKLQRDEIAIHKIKLEAVLGKETNVLKQLLADGKKNPAQLLLKKKRFQQFLLTDAEKELNEVMNKTNDPLKFTNIKTEAENYINRNNETLKKIKLLLSLEDIEMILEEGQKGRNKQEEVNRILRLATTGERKRLEGGLDEELNKISSSINDVKKATTDSEESTPAQTVTASQEEAENQKESNVIDLEEYLNDEVATNAGNKTRRKSVNANLFEDIPNKIGGGVHHDESFVSDSTEEESTWSVAADDSKIGVSETATDSNVTLAGSFAQLASKSFSDVTEEAFSDEVGNKPGTLQMPQPEST